ncbi:CBO0543 family protein [Alkalihalobacterium elongatum]|uniref:CBO0543 family protein n=1 Tax=Alkalihalobacterium elongatum TaxID=2675466 RepID=UPI001C1F9988|nr:CBO0543 family protein [Alkalihalobacterium elongatum]
MHFTLTLIVVIAIWVKGDYKNWQKYHTTMLYYALGNLTYNFLCANYLLWKLDPDIMPNHSMTEMLYTFVVFPGTILMFLRHYPSTFKKQIIHNSIWIAIYVGIEYFFLLTGRIYYQFGWNLGWSALLVAIMFPMFRLHHKRPILTYVISVIITILLVWIFDVPVDVPIEERPRHDIR